MNRIPLRSLEPLLGRLVAGLVGFAVFLVVFGPSVLPPSNIHWLMEGDWAQHFLGWQLFRLESWTLPLGSLRGFGPPVDATIGLTDSLPLFAFPLKLVQTWLPTDFQYVGLWFALCFVLQGVAGAMLTEVFSRRWWDAALGGALFALSPILLWRLGHDSLCAHWSVLFLLMLCLRAALRTGPLPRAELAANLGLGVVSALTHPYLWAMISVLAVAHVVTAWKVGRLSGRFAAVTAGVYFVVTLGLLAAMGYFGGGALAPREGLSGFSADLLTLLNPMGRSRLIPELPTRPGQYEGYGFVGTGILVLAVISAVLAWRNRAAFWALPWRATMPVLVATGLLGIFSLGSIWRLAGHRVLKLAFLYDPLLPLLAPFRSNGRFIWPLAYLLMAGAIALVLRHFRSAPGKGTAVLAVALVVQAADLHFPHPARSDASAAGWDSMSSTRASELARGKTKLVMVPPQLRGMGAEPCEAPGEYADDRYVAPAYYAYRHRLQTNSFYVARLSNRRVQAYCGELRDSLAVGHFDRAAVYLVAPSLAPLFANPAVRCESVDAWRICVTSPEGEETDP